MSEQKFLKAACEHCEDHIEFPAEGAGMSVPCPHCQKRTRLNAPAIGSVPEFSPASPPAAPKATPPPASRTPVAPASPGISPAAREPSSKVGLLVGITIGLLALGAGGYFGYKKFLSKSETESAIASPKPAKKTKRPETNSEAANTETVVTPATIKAKSLQDLKPGPVTLEKSKGGSSLVYGVGDLRNDSEHQRFGVKVELSVFDAAGKNVGKATDYIQVIEPRNSWRFHALILDPKATSAKIANVSEAE